MNQNEQPRGPRSWDEAMFQQQEQAQSNGWTPERTPREWEELRQSKSEADMTDMEIAGQLVMRPELVKYIILHSSKTAPGTSIGAVEIDRMHRSRRYLKIGYHYVVRREGTVEVGRSTMEPGCHTRGYNGCSIGVCLVGGRDLLKKPQDNFTQPQKDSLKTLLAQLAEQFPDAKVVKHSDLDHSVQCPSLD